MAIIKAPFNQEQVGNINHYQFEMGNIFHPFTCPDRSDGKHQKDEMSGQLGVLVAGESGLYCQYCGYTQKWVHDFMAIDQLIK